MTDIPVASSYPEAFDNDTNLFLVHDSLRVRLAEDYNPGDKIILIEGNESVMAKFPPTGLITLTEQCSEVDERAISFFYGSRTDTSFNDLVIIPTFVDVVKPKRITNVTQNVMAQHHNAIKDALIAIQTFLGVEGTTDTLPLGSTLEGRINFLTKLVLKPKAWFTVDKRIGLVPLCITFTDQSTRLGDDEVVYIWDFGDNTTQVISSCVSGISGISCTISSIAPSVTSISTTLGPISATDVIVQDTDGGQIIKCYTEPGNFKGKLTVRNKYGEDTVEFENLINARIEAPNEAVVTFIPRAAQDFTEGSPVGGPYTTPPKIRSIANLFIDFEVEQGENSSTPGRSYAGELLSNGTAIDPVIEYTWRLNDDLNHTNSPIARASYSVGGLYDMQLRVDTQFGSFRITTYEDAIDIVESENLWLWKFNSINSLSSGVVQAYEFGLISETFKTLGNQTLTISRDNSFLDDYNSPDYDTTTEARAKNEFFRNVYFCNQGTTTSGNAGLSLLFWAAGGDTIAAQEIKIKQYNAFTDVYSNVSSITRPWNWAVLNSGDTVSFIFGQNPTVTADENKAFPQRLDFDLTSLIADSPETIDSGDFENGADELLDHPSIFNDGIPTNGYFAVYRTAWKDTTGYILRNSGANEFFRLADFYKTRGNLSNPFITITKLPDITGSVKVEGQFATMTNGVFFFNNSGEISAWNDTSATWEVGRASSSSLSFRSLQDDTVSGFDNKANSLLVASDKERIAYLSYDYSTSAFIKFNGTDQTFSLAGTRPTGTQFTMGIY